MRYRYVVMFNTTSWCLGLLVGAFDGALVEWSAIVLTAFAGLMFVPLVAAGVHFLPAATTAEKWGPRDLFLPALASSTAFSFVIANVIQSSAALWLM